MEESMLQLNRSPEAEKVFNTLAGDLERRGELHLGDGLPLYLLAEAVVDYEYASRKVEEEGMVVTGSQGDSYQFPWFTAKFALSKRITDLLKKVGLVEARR